MNTAYSSGYPEHDRTSCNDEDLSNVDPDGSGCRRCNALLFDRYFDLEREVRGLRKDADRWRAWRKASVSGDAGFFRAFVKHDTGHDVATEDGLDASVDAAMEVSYD